LVVMVGHARWLLWEGYSEGYLKHPAQYNFVEKILVYFFAAFKYGHQSVLFFFVLSGFVIHLKYSKSLQKNPAAKFNVGNYLYRRVKRIYPPFLFILLVTYLLDYFGTKFGYSIYSGQTPNTLLNNNISLNHSWTNLLGNLLFWRGSTVDIWGTNTPLWSLKYEWWFYMIYPLLFGVNKKSVLISGIVVVSIFIASLFVSFPAAISFIQSVLQYLLFWWFGALLADIYTKRSTLSYSYLSAFIIILPFMAVFGERWVSNTMVSDGIWALGFFGLLNFFFFLQQKGFRLNFMKRLKWLGDCSYTLYIIHFPILVFINGIILHSNGNQMPKSFIYVLLVIPFIIFISYVIHFFVEKPFTTARK
jgi:peptidoglycan/LPS O-acetylase OafA/YrhL